MSVKVIVRGKQVNGFVCQDNANIIFIEANLDGIPDTDNLFLEYDGYRYKRFCGLTNPMVWMFVIL